MSGSDDERIELPPKPIDRLVSPIVRFMHVEAASGIVLLACTVVALVLANSKFSAGFLGLWKTEFGVRFGSFEVIHSLKHWINDGLMAVFFFVVGLEVKRELVLGELRDVRRAALPFAAAIGGMMIPAAIYLGLLAGEPGARGWGIPMATDIAFVVGCMAILGSRVPPILRVILLSLAIVDDIGAILVIAIGYTETIHVGALMWAAAGIVVVFILGRVGVRSFAVYTALGAIVWFGFHESGVHATIAGVILGLMTPTQSYVSEGLFAGVLQRASDVLHGEWATLPHRAERVRRFQWAARETISPLEYLETALHPWVGFLIMPVFALANAGVPFEVSDFRNPIALAVMAGLVVGKPLGILFCSFLAVRLVLKRLPDGVDWGMMLGGGCLAGIGFTMALFIAGLALDGAALDAAKVGVLGGSAVSAMIGILLLLIFGSKSAVPESP